MFVVVAIVAIALVIGLASFFTGRYVDATHRDLDERLRIYAALAAKAGDATTAFDALAADEELAAVEVYAEDGSLVARHGRDAGRVQRSAHGTVVVAMSTERADAQIAAAYEAALTVGLVAVGLALVGAWLIGRHLAVRLGGLASRVADGVPCEDASDDEIGRLSGSFNTMATRLLTAQSREIELLLANVAEGFVIVDRKGEMGLHRSAALVRWFGAYERGTPLWSLFAADDPNAAAYLELAWEALFDGFLPAEVALEQFPKRLRHGGSIFELVVRPIREENGDVTSALVVLRDVTDAILREESDATRGDLTALCERALSDKEAVIDFVSESEPMLRAIEGAERLIDVKRAVHTLKGVAGQLGAANIALSCETIEEGMETTEDGRPRPADAATLFARWHALASRLSTLFAKAGPNVHVERADLDLLLGRIEGHAPAPDLARFVKLLRLEPMQIRLDRQTSAAVALAKRLGKDVEVQASGGRLRADAEVWAPFWNAFTHVVRNAIDHGIEPVERRLKRGKRARATVRIDVVRSSTSVTISCADDGGGIDWFKLAKKASACGLSAETPADLENALFFDGLSTLDECSDISGRGIGMGAVRAVTESMGGTVAVESRTGHGTTVRFTIPVTALGDAFREDSPLHAVAA